MAAGRFITFEGGEGAGKSTQAARLAAWLRRRGIAVVATREPGGSPGAEAIRALLVEGGVDRWDATAEMLLLFAARADHLRRTIRPALAQGIWVVCDRFVDSSMAYQGYGHGLGPGPVAAAAGLVPDMTMPDLTLVFDIDVAEGLRRAALRRDGEARFETMATAFHQRVRRGFLEIAAGAPERCHVIDAAADPDAVWRQVEEAVTQRLLRSSR